MDEKNIKPNLFNTERTLVITYASLETPSGGSSVLMRNLLDNYNQNSFLVVSIKPFKKTDFPKYNNSYILPDIHKLPARIQSLVYPFATYFSSKRLQKLASKYQPNVVFIIYPTLFNVDVFLKCKFDSNAKLVGYFHDTFIEGQLHQRSSEMLVKKHTLLLNKLDGLFVMNEGMRELYYSKYQYNTISLEHCYPDIHNSYYINTNKIKKVIWGGNVIDYNSKALTRLIKCFSGLGYTVEIATRQKEKNLSKILSEDLIFNKTFYSNRDEYINALSYAEFTLLALDWPEETKFHFDEIATIFSTKAIEYMHSGVPIILHCPKDYFMASFFNDNNCGYVISEKEPFKLKQIIEDIILHKRHEIKTKNAKKIAQLFSPKNVMGKINIASKEWNLT